jgi:carboxyl-terminal processing protease
MISVTITREIIQEQNSLCFYLPEQKIYYLSLNSFTQNSIKQIEELLKKSHNHSYKGLIIDMRFNTGGLLSAAIDIIGLFLPKGSLVVQTKGRENNNVQDYFTTRDPIVNSTLPIFILINNYTASAAEILAGCLQQHSISFAKQRNKQQLMVFLVGTRTFGKGSVQEVIPIGNDCAVKMTTALYFLPGDISIQGVGIEPDFEINRLVPQNEQIQWFAKSHGFEKSLPHTIETAQSKKHADQQKENDKKKNSESKHKKWALRLQEGLQQDNQFKAAIHLINMYDVIKKCSGEQASNRTVILQQLKQIFLDDKALQMQEVKGTLHY